MRRQRDLWRDPLLLTFAACAFMFQLSNDAVLPFAVTAIQVVGLKDTDTLVSVALVVSQGVAALIAPRLGGLAQARGRKLVLLMGFVALAVRCLVLATNGIAASIVACQVLDGISASTVGVVVPLVVADITHRGGRFNLAMGVGGSGYDRRSDIQHNHRRVCYRELGHESCIHLSGACGGGWMRVGTLRFIGDGTATVPGKEMPRPPCGPYNERRIRRPVLLQSLTLIPHSIEHGKSVFRRADI